MTRSLRVLLVLAASVVAVGIPAGSGNAAPPCKGPPPHLDNTRCDSWNTPELLGSDPRNLDGGGVTIYSNGANAEFKDCSGRTVATYERACKNDVNGVPTGAEWQCVELINRLYLTKGWISKTWSGNGNDLYRTARSVGLADEEADGAITGLAAGDVVSFDHLVKVKGKLVSDGAGHAAIVNSVGAPASDGSVSVQLLNQNAQQVFSTATLKAGRLVVSWGSFYPTIGVIHRPSPPPPLPPPSPGGLKIAAGIGHTCGVTEEGAVKCWGSNSYGQLGDGTTSDSLLPVLVSDLSSGVVAVSAGGFETCALSTGGSVTCWGYGMNGELGNGVWGNSSTPVSVSGLSSGVIQISVGNDFACAVTAGGAAKCWGSNIRGSLGDGTTIPSSIPVTVTGLSSGVAAVAAGQDNQACAILNSGAVECWGENGGQLGDGFAEQYSTTPVPVTGLSTGAIDISGGDGHSCAAVTGGAECWGNNSYGELGDGTSDNVAGTPVAVIGLSGAVAAVSAGAFFTCALLDGGAVQCWGANESGELGNGTNTNSSVPLPVVGLSSDVANVAAGALHACAMVSNGAVACWGSNMYGQIGTGDTKDSSIPLIVIGF
jgi:alpha-tubulin suppressor-like RCC1 family protein